MFAYDKQGSVFAMSDGAELLAHDGPSEGPLWRATLDAPIVALGADGTQIGAITRSGTITWFAARTGERQGTTALNATIERAIIDATKRRVVAVSANAITSVTGDDAPVELAAHGATAIAQKPDGTVLAAHDGLVLLTAAGRETKPFAGGSISALAWHPSGFWIIGLPAELYRWDDGEPKHLTSLPQGKALDAVAATDKAIALSMGRSTVVSLAYPSLDTLASATYPERKVEGIDFGPWPWLGIALDLGDGNKHNLEAPDRLHRSDTHPGRQHHSWLVSVGGPTKPAQASAAAPVRAAAKPTSKLSVIVAIAIALLVVFVLTR